MKKWELSLLLGLILSVFLTSFSGFSAVCSDVREDTLRLHILANSNSKIDQDAKLYVRDCILKNEGSFFAKSGTKEKAKAKAQDLLLNVEKTARDALREKGLNYAVKAYTTEMYFATTEYDGFTLPAGRYDALRVELGEAKGKNWFCVLFPPLCVPASMDDAATGYTDAEISAVHEPYKAKFAIVEWVQLLSETLHGK
ncbi:MAG: stage II sporulation protein R [Oscillospiraceae bacterium]